MGQVSVGQVKPAAARAYLDGHGPVTGSWTLKWGTLRGFYRYAMARSLVRHSPLPSRAPKVVKNFTPYIYTHEQLQALLQAVTPERAKSLSAQTLRTLLLLLYGAGLRLSEALNLEDGQVDLQERLLCVRRSKFFKTRLVPIGPKLAQVLADYERSRPSIHESCQWFFRNRQGRKLNADTVRGVFRGLCQAAGVERKDGSRYGPRLHDLRHAMATHCLLAWYRAGADIGSRLLQLSVYLGHAELADTQIYLTVTSELREQASERFARYAWGGDHE
jgi:integrase/recombinase XerD